jgi:ketosteroid isomerase-like protein
MRAMIVWAGIVAAALRVDAQAPAATNVDQTLQAEIARVDSLLFAAFNAGDLKRLKAFFAPDLEFYQDNEGLENYAQTMKDFQEMLPQPSKIRRELVSGSLEVYPIKNYGAIEVGSHRFCHEENGRTECGTFKFLHVWRKTGNTWRLSRIVSYSH